MGSGTDQAAGGPGPVDRTPEPGPIGRGRNSPAANAKFLLQEFFEGDAVLTQEVRAQGLTALPPEGLATGGLDMSQPAAVKLLCSRWKALRSEGVDLAVHFAPPCSTFSRARDRRKNTQLRSLAHPEGLRGAAAAVEVGNRVAEHTLC